MDDLYQNNNYYNRKVEDGLFPPVITIADCDGPQATGAQGTGHGGEADEVDDQHGDGVDGPRHGLRDEDPGDDLGLGRPHGLGRLDDAPIHFLEGRFQHPGKERGGGEGQRDQGGRWADGPSQDQLGQGDAKDHEDHIRNGPDDIDHQVQEPVEGAVLGQASMVRDEEEETQRSSQKDSQKGGQGHHIEGFQGRLKKQLG